MGRVTIMPRRPPAASKRNGKNELAFPPKSHRALRSGVNTLARLIRPTLGPTGRTVLIDHVIRGTRPPEILDDAGVIARRFLGLEDGFAHAGAMLTRYLAVHVKDQAGDGAATAVVLADATLREATRLVAAGASAMALSRHLDGALKVALEKLAKLATPIEEPAEIARLIEASIPDPEIASMLAEIYDIVGRDGVVLVESASGRTLDREYAEGIQWQKGYASLYLVNNENRGDVTVVEPAILVTNHRLTKAEQLVPILQKLTEAGEKNLFIVAKEISGDALALLVMNKQRNVIQPLAVEAPHYGKIMEGILGDIAILTGARYVREENRDRIEEVSLADLGRARRAWANRDFFNIWGGHGKPSEVRKRIAQVKNELKLIAPTEEYELGKTRERLGKLMGGVGILKVGAPTEAERDERKARAEQAVAIVRSAVEEGILPGAGVAYIRCIPAMEERAAGKSGEERWAWEVLARALEEPTRIILENAGYEANPILADLRDQPDGWGFDVKQGAMVDLCEAGIVVPHKVARTALEQAVSTARMALTTDILIHRPKNDALGPA